MTSPYRAVVVHQAPGVPQQLFLLLHGWGASADDLVPLGERLARGFPLRQRRVPLMFPDTSPLPD